MLLVFLGHLAILGCLFIFKVDGLIWGGWCGFPPPGTGGPASRMAIGFRARVGEGGEGKGLEGRLCGHPRCLP